MEDLRKSHSVKRRSNFNIRIWWNRNRGILKSISLLAILSLIVIKPSVVGSKIGNWFNVLISSFTDQSDVTTHQWVVILGTVLVVIICYKLIQWRNNS